MSKKTIVRKIDDKKIDLRMKQLELGVITLTLMVMISGSNKNIDVSLSIFLVLISIIIVLISLKFDSFINESNITETTENDTPEIDIVSKVFNWWDLFYFSLFLLSIFLITIQQLSPLFFLQR